MFFEKVICRTFLITCEFKLKLDMVIKIQKMNGSSELTLAPRLATRLLALVSTGC